MSASHGERIHSDRRIIELAAAQYGLVTRAQLLEGGLTRGRIQSRIRATLLQPVHAGVYQVGPLAPRHVRERAAVLACGRDGLISHRSAASLWEMLSPLEDAHPVDITVRQRGARRAGVRVHRVIDLEPDERAEIEGIPVTSPARTILDLAGTVPRRDLEQALAQGERAEIVSREEVRALAKRRPKRRGIALLRHLLDASRSPALTRSEAEKRFLALLRKAGLPRPETNVKVGRYEVDFLWRPQWLAVEVDGYAFHSSRPRFEADRRRDIDLAGHGLQVLRVTWHQITEEREATLVRLTKALEQRAASA